MNLKPKFTGYNAERTSFSVFTEYCYSLQGLGAIKVISVSENEYPKNYYSAFVEDDFGKFYILKNCFVESISFSEQDYGPYTFLSKPKLAKSAAEIGIASEILSPSVLNESVSEKNLEKLESVEKIEVKNWLPETIGGLLFSWYFD